MSDQPTQDSVSIEADLEQRLAAIVDSSFDAIISKDLNSIIQSWNAAAERLFGYTAEEAIGRSVLMLIPDSNRNEEVDIISRIKRGERVESYETVRKRKDGSYIAVSMTVSPVRAKDGRIVGASKIARDITASKESELRIRLLMREVNHRTKNQFAVILSIIRETAKRALSPDEFGRHVRERIMAMSRSHDLLVNADWEGALIHELLNSQLQPFGDETRVILTGPPLKLNPNAVQNLGMAFHELGTNSAKYGVLSNGRGEISVDWRVRHLGKAERQFELDWRETGIAPNADAGQSQHTGFGSVVLQRVVPQSLGGSATLERSADRLAWSLVVPLRAIIPQSGVETSDEI